MSTLYDTDAARWKAVRENDAAADGTFFYAVRTTGIYCRPSCRSRRPKRENAAFFDTPAAAEAAGFRPCRRCRPDTAQAADPATQAITAACRAIEAAEAVPALTVLAAEAGLSPSRLQRLFKERLGVSPKAYATAVRARRLDAALATGEGVTTAIYDAGYNASSRAYADADARFGMTLGTRARGGEGEVIRHAAAPCCLGWVLVAATDRGLCAIELGDDAAACRESLRRRFARARLEPAEPAFAETVARVAAWLAEPTGALGLPLDIRGTAFQEQVWAELRRVPSGETVSYAALAARVGRPEAVRATAGAVAANPLAVVVPCHRVVRSDGGVSGYRWGTDRKRRLLAREAEKKTQQ